jgi:aspartyl-tRNA(Asn)/glutamyl-tRNA(Gln) amidotransferase subunit C
MKLTVEEVRHVAALARLSLSSEEEETYRTQLSAILTAVDSLREVATDDVEPTSHASMQEEVLRPDERRPSLSSEDVLRNAPASVGTSFAVPKIIE